MISEYLEWGRHGRFKKSYLFVIAPSDNDAIWVLRVRNQIAHTRHKVWMAGISCFVNEFIWAGAGTNKTHYCECTTIPTSLAEILLYISYCKNRANFQNTYDSCSHNLADKSLEPEIIFPSGVTAKQRTSAVWPHKELENWYGFSVIISAIFKKI